MFFTSETLYASRIKSGYEALLVKDYFKSQNKLKKALKYNTSTAAFGLATIYSRNDNPFYNIDSAYHYANLSDSTWSLTKEKKKAKWAKYGWTQKGIDSLKVLVSSQFYNLAKKDHSIESYTKFISEHPWSIELTQAIDTRDSLAFFETVNMNSAASYDSFMRSYPNSKYSALAEDNFYNSQYHEHTKGDSLELYLSFIDLYPNSPKRADAEKRVFELVTLPNTSEAYEDFVINYPDYSFNAVGWDQFYQVYLFDYSLERKIEFLQKFPDAKNKLFVQSDILMTDSLFLPNLNNSKYGFSNYEGRTIIEAEYDYVGAFSEGLATVVKGELQGAINKLGQLQIPIQYEAVGAFHQGRAMIESNGKVGLIDRNNKLILQAKYEDLGDATEGLIYIQKEEKYGYVDLNGNLVIPELFDEAFDFKNGRAIVEINGSLGIINSKGDFVIHAEYDNLRKINDTLYVCSKDGKQGILNPEGHLIIIPTYDQIGSFSDGLALATKSDTLIYINAKGEVVLDKGYKIFPNYLLKGEFNRGAAIVYKKGKYGRVNLKGDVVTDIIYENLGLSEKFIPFQKEGEWGLMSMSNKVLISSMYESIDVYENKFVVASLDDSIGMLGVNGNVLIPFEFNEIEWLIDDYVKVQRDNYYALFKGGKQLTPFDLTLIELFNDEFVSLLGENQLNYINIETGELVFKKEVGE